MNLNHEFHALVTAVLEERCEPVMALAIKGWKALVGAQIIERIEKAPSTDEGINLLVTLYHVKNNNSRSRERIIEHLSFELEELPKYADFVAYYRKYDSC
jgi:hypothetical protein